jgi:hypothetical protein
MAFPTGTHTATTLASFIPELWGQRINDFMRSKLVMASFFVDRSSELADGGDILYTPNMTEMTANAKSDATAVTLNYPTDTKITLTVNQWYEVSFAIEDRDAAQAKRSYYIQENYAKGAGFAAAKKLEVAIAALFLGFSQVVGSSVALLADSDIRNAIAYLESANVDTTSDCAFFVHPNVFWKHLQSIDKFSLAVNSPVNDPTAKRPQATLYGIPVYVTSNIQYISETTGRANALAHKDAIHWATSPLGAGSEGPSVTGSMGVRVQSNYMPDFLSTLTTADILYGVIENRDTSGVYMKSST